MNIKAALAEINNLYADDRSAINVFALKKILSALSTPISPEKTTESLSIKNKLEIAWYQAKECGNSIDGFFIFQNEIREILEIDKKDKDVKPKTNQMGIFYHKVQCTGSIQIAITANGQVIFCPTCKAIMILKENK